MTGRHGVSRARLRYTWDRLSRMRRLGGTFRLGRWIVATVAARLFGSEFRYTRLAARAQARIRGGRSAAAAKAAGDLVAAAPGPDHRAVADDLRKAVETGARARALQTAVHATRRPDLGTEKIVSRKYRFLWICNPKVASRSIIQVLCAADPEAKLFERLSVADVLALQPEARDYFTFAFVRNPFHRAVSFYEDKFLRKPWELARFERRYHGLSWDMDFESVCAWLAGPYGADAFADRHWLSQHRQVAVAAGRMPDFVGRHETIEDDFRTATRRVGLPDLQLPYLNTVTGRESDRDTVETAQRALEATRLTGRIRELLRGRYADDFRIFGYDPE